MYKIAIVNSYIIRSLRNINLAIFIGIIFRNGAAISMLVYTEWILRFSSVKSEIPLRPTCTLLAAAKSLCFPCPWAFGKNIQLRSPFSPRKTVYLGITNVWVT